MNKGNTLQQTEPTQNSKSILVIIISVVITALIIGSVVYLWQKSVLKSTEQSLQGQINSLQKQVNRLKNEQKLSDNSLSQPTEQKAQDSDAKYRVLLKENTSDGNKTDVYLKNLDNNTETFFMSISDVDSQNYHNNEYHNGNLYIIRKIGDSEHSNGKWIDELWRYDAQKNGTKLYSDKIVDFRVNDDESILAIVTKEGLTLLDNRGKILEQFQNEEVVTDHNFVTFRFLAWGQNSLWLDNRLGPNLVGIVNIDTKSYAVAKYELPDFQIAEDFAFNSYAQKLAFSDYPVLFEELTAESFKKRGTKVKLWVYDLKTKKKQLIDASVAKRFAPKWIDKNTLEYNDPNSEGRVQKVIE